MSQYVTSEIVENQIEQLKEIFQNSTISLFNDYPKRAIYQVHTKYSVGRITLKMLKKIKASLIFIEWLSQDGGLRLLIEVRV